MAEEFQPVADVLLVREQRDLLSGELLGIPGVHREPLILRKALDDLGRGELAEQCPEKRHARLFAVFPAVLPETGLPVDDGFARGEFPCFKRPFEAAEGGMLVRGHRNGAFNLLIQKIEPGVTVLQGRPDVLVFVLQFRFAGEKFLDLKFQAFVAFRGERDLEHPGVEQLGNRVIQRILFLHFARIILIHCGLETVVPGIIHFPGLVRRSIGDGLGTELILREVDEMVKRLRTIFLVEDDLHIHQRRQRRDDRVGFLRSPTEIIERRNQSHARQPRHQILPAFLQQLLRLSGNSFGLIGKSVLQPFRHIIDLPAVQPPFHLFPVPIRTAIAHESQPRLRRIIPARIKFGNSLHFILREHTTKLYFHLSLVDSVCGNRYFSGILFPDDQIADVNGRQAGGNLLDGFLGQLVQRPRRNHAGADQPCRQLLTLRKRQLARSGFSFPVFCHASPPYPDRD